MASLRSRESLSIPLGICLIVAPLLLLASTVAYALGDGFNGDRTGGTIQVYAMAAFVPVILGLATMVGQSQPRLAAALILLGSLGAAGGVAYGIDSIHYGETRTSVEDYGAAGPFALQIPGAMFPLSLLGIAAGFLRSGAEPRWPFALLALAAVLFPASRIPRVEELAIIADSLFILALVPLGWRILSGADAETAVATPARRLHSEA